MLYNCTHMATVGVKGLTSSAGVTDREMTDKIFPRRAQYSGKVRHVKLLWSHGVQQDCFPIIEDVYLVLKNSIGLVYFFTVIASEVAIISKFKVVGYSIFTDADCSSFF